MKKNLGHDSVSSESHRANLFAKVLQTAAEVYAVWQFCRLADEIGRGVPGAEEVLDYVEAIQHAEVGYSPLIKSSKKLFVDVPFAFAQHHGIPTRYLDWTLDPIIAAHFAADSAVGEGESQDGDLCVIALRRDGIAAERVGWVTVPRSGHHYLHAQHGLFSVHEHANEFFQRHERWPMFEDAFIDYPLQFNRGGNPYERFEGMENCQMQRLLLPRREANRLRRMLFERRISRAHLMPTLDHVAGTVQQRWEWYGEQ